MAVDDDEMLNRCQQGDDAGLRDLVERYQDRIFRMAYRVLGDATRAEDATADAFAVIWEKCRSWRGESKAGTWIHRVASNVIFDHQRAAKRWWRFWALREVVSVRQSDRDDPAIIIADNDAKLAASKRIEIALSKLGTADRMLVQLHYYEEQSLAEIADVMGVTRAALKMRLIRLRQELRESLGNKDAER